MRNERSPTRDVFGLLLLDKPRGLSSNRALQRVKRLFGAGKAGHAGSLDPLATGMLPIFFGSATRLAGFMLEARKTYRVEARLGISTTTGDAEGDVLEDRSGEPAPAADAIAAAAARFVGEISQVPPMYSALKRSGVPLYRLARSGIEVERSPRQVSIEQLVIEAYDWPRLELFVRCSKGTYVRTLVEDIARAAGTIGHVAALRRLTVGTFREEEMRTLAEIEEAAAAGTEVLDALLSPADRAVETWPSTRLEPGETARLRSGQAVAADPSLPCGHVKVYGDSGELIAIGLVTEEGRLAPTRVFVR